MLSSNHMKSPADAAVEQQTDGRRKGVKLLKVLIKMAVTVLTFALVISALNYIASPAKSYTRIQFHDLYTKYGKDGKNMDIVFLGTSHAYRTFDTAIFDDVLGKETYNFGTSQQTIPASYYVLKEILKTNHPDKVVFELTYTCFNDKEHNPIKSVILSQYMKPSKNKWDYILHEFDLENIFYPLVPAYTYRENLKAETLSSILQDKTTEEFLNYDPEITRTDKEWMEEKGFVYTNKSFHHWHVGQMDPEGWDEDLIEPKYMDYFYRIIDLCDEENVDLVLITTPCPKATLLELGNYDEVCDYFNAIAEEKNIPYYNYNLLKPDALFLENEDFYDSTHLNGKGAKKFSKLVASMFSEEEKGSLNLSDYFYESWDEAKQDIDYITNAAMTVEADDERYYLTAHAYSGLDDPEYEYTFYVYDEEGQNRKLLRDWSTDPSYEMPLNYAPEGEVWQVQVGARFAGSDTTIDEAQRDIKRFPYEFSEEELAEN